MTASRSMRDRVSRWWSQASEKPVYRVIPVAGAEEPVARNTYLRLWLTDLGLARSRGRAADLFPALRATVSFASANRPQRSFSTVVQAPSGEQAPGSRSRRLTDLVPYLGGSVEIDACLYAVKGDDSLRLALDVIGGISSLVLSPLTAMAGVADRISAGIDLVESALDASGPGPAVTLHREYAGAGALTDPLRPGHLVVVNTPVAGFDADGLSVSDGELRVGGEPVDGLDYLVLEVQCLREREDWDFVGLDDLRNRAIEARYRGNDAYFAQLKQELMIAVMTSADLVPPDRQRLASRLQDDLEQLPLGAAGEQRARTVADLVRDRGLPTAGQVADVTLERLLGDRG